ncbi:MAG: hypothetical protein ACKVW3_01760 [Phycisphaerales bacterium]
MSPCIAYQDINLRPKALKTIADANEIIAEYAAQGFDLTLRQLFYQFVSRGLIPNTQREYKNLGAVINDGRLAGLVDWDSIVDRTRNLRSLAHWKSPKDIVNACAGQFRYDLWNDQPNYCEVWIEKDALVGVIEGVCHRYDVPHFSCRGYVSQSEMWGAAQRIETRAERREEIVVIHLGDHDPSGMDMSRDIEDRLRLFVGGDVGDRLEVRRVALNPDQVRQYNPPPNPAKITDSRAKEYIRRHGRQSWELDALEPAVIAALIEAEIDGLLDPLAWEAAQARQARARGLLGGVAKRWEQVVELLNGETP